MRLIWKIKENNRRGISNHDTMKVHHIRREDRLPDTMQWSTCRMLSIVTTCLICHSGCIGHRQKACNISDLNMYKGDLPWHIQAACRRVLKSCKLSSHTDPSSFLIHELREYVPTL